MLRGVVVPMITPFREDFEIDLDALEWLVNHLIRGGVDFIFPNSSTGESTSLSLDERKKLIQKVMELVSGRTKVLPGIGGISTLEVIELGRFVKDVGADGGIAITPYFFKLSPKELKAHYSRVATAIDIPIVIYHYPALTGITLPVETVVELALEHSNIAGIKVTYDSVAYLKRLINEVKGVRKDFSVFSGLDYLMLFNLMLGGDGSVGSLSNLTPKLHSGIYRAWISGDLVKAYSLYMKLHKLTRLLEISPTTVAAVKAALTLAGTPVKPVLRPPLSSVGEDFKKVAGELIKELSDFIF
ncbi:MAG: 4-hydroxy-tetrahydrodipicolinate synthase [Zestosphaera sp.]